MRANQIPLSAERVLVTGASGFIGLQLCRALLDRDHEVHALSRSKPDFADTRFRWRKVDLTDIEATRSAIADIRADLVFHLCSHAQGEYDLALVLPTFRSELQTTVNVLTCLAETGCKRLVMAGSMEEPEPGDVPSSPYAAAKAASRAYAMMFGQLYGLSVALTRIFMVYGPGQASKKVIPHSVGCLLRGDPLTIVSPGRKVDWIYVEDVVDGLLTVAATPGLEGKSVDLGSGELVEIGETVRRIQRLINPGVAVEFGALPAKTFEPARCADVAATCALTGWRSKVSLEAGLARTVDFYARASGRTA